MHDLFARQMVRQRPADRLLTVNGIRSACLVLLLALPTLLLDVVEQEFQLRDGRVELLGWQHMWPDGGADFTAYAPDGFVRVYKRAGVNDPGTEWFWSAGTTSMGDSAAALPRRNAKRAWRQKQHGSQIQRR